MKKIVFLYWTLCFRRSVYVAANHFIHYSNLFRSHFSCSNRFFLSLSLSSTNKNGLLHITRTCIWWHGQELFLPCPRSVHIVECRFLYLSLSPQSMRGISVIYRQALFTRLPSNKAYTVWIISFIMCDMEVVWRFYWSMWNVKCEMNETG